MHEGAAKSGKGASKWGRKRRSLGLAAVLLLPAATGGAWFLFGHSTSSAPQKAKAGSEVRAVLHLDPFLVNLADPDGDRFLRVGIELGLHRDLSDHAGQSALPIARTRDTILMVLTTCNAGALLPPAGKVKLKEELTKALREHVPELGVQEVYFTEFLVQR
jgi:flagellar FliL protein